MDFAPSEAETNALLDEDSLPFLVGNGYQQLGNLLKDSGLVKTGAELTRDAKIIKDNLGINVQSGVDLTRLYSPGYPKKGLFTIFHQLFPNACDHNQKQSYVEVELGPKDAL
ncbi:hypothetical protein HK102_009839 [Quaeritorhiza haematococci]|nr:hypothetical protein HK102_009839 [Quaeritorhiza haematococci]